MAATSSAAFLLAWWCIFLSAPLLWIEGASSSNFQTVPSFALLQQKRSKTNFHHNPNHESSKRRLSYCLLSALPPPADSSVSFPTMDFHLTSIPSSPLLLLLQIISAFITYIALIIYYDRPRGGQLSSSVLLHQTKQGKSSFCCLEVRPSRIPNAGLGLFVTQSLPKGTILGTYPGVLRPSNQFYLKYKKYPICQSYAWKFTDELYFLDPTSEFNGTISSSSDIILGGTISTPLSIWIHQQTPLLRYILGVPSSSLLTRINEPPSTIEMAKTISTENGNCRVDCNVSSEEDIKNRCVTFFLNRNVDCNEELYIDYGKVYDRSDYTA